MSQGAVKELHRHQIPFIKKTPAPIDDLDIFDFVICMSQDQIRYLSKGGPRKNLSLLLDFEGSHHSISNPAPKNNFSFAYSLIYKGCMSFLEYLQKHFASDDSVTDSSTQTKVPLNLQINESLFKRFEAALVLTKEPLESALEKSINLYINDSAKILTGPQGTGDDAIEKFIKSWAHGAGRINQIIIKSFFKSVELDGKATFASMKALCSNQKQYPRLFIYKHNGFENFYRKMKASEVQDGHIKKGNSIDGKVFWEDGDEVKILSDVLPAIEKHKSYFKA